MNDQLCIDLSADCRVPWWGMQAQPRAGAPAGWLETLDGSAIESRPCARSDMDLLSAYIPADRLQALAHGTALPSRARGAALFADISGFTPLTEALVRTLGPRRGAEELTRQLNEVYDALIDEVNQHGGSVISFAGDAITCWFDASETRPAQRAVACALAMQK